LWDNTEGIQDALIASWVEVVKATASNEMVLGYDLINEPSLGYKSMNEELFKMGKFYKKAIGAIRNAEQSNNLPEHIAFFEMGISWNGEPIPSTVSPQFTDEQNLVFAPHNYFESITYLLTIEQGYEGTHIFNKTYKTHLFMGEWGFFDGNPENDISKMKRFAKMEDKYLYSSTFWQWSQSPGDPHGVNYDGTTPQQTSMALIELDQAAQFTGNINNVFLKILSRNRPIAIVGQPKSFETDADNGKMKLKAISGKTGITKLWINKRYGTPIIDGQNSILDKLETVEGGFIAHVTVEGNYEINVNY
jgi:endoglycosylceramidase